MTTFAGMTTNAVALRWGTICAAATFAASLSSSLRYLLHLSLSRWFPPHEAPTIWHALALNLAHTLPLVLLGGVAAFLQDAPEDRRAAWEATWGLTLAVALLQSGKVFQILWAARAYASWMEYYLVERTVPFLAAGMVAGLVAGMRWRSQGGRGALVGGAAFGWVVITGAYRVAGMWPGAGHPWLDLAFGTAQSAAGGVLGARLVAWFR